MLAGHHGLHLLHQLGVQLIDCHLKGRCLWPLLRVLDRIPQKPAQLGASALHPLQISASACTPSDFGFLAANWSDMWSNSRQTLLASFEPFKLLAACPP